MPQQIKLLRAGPDDAERPRSLERDPGPAAAKSADAAEWEALCRHPRRVPWRHALEMSDAVLRVSQARQARAARQPW